MMKIAVPLALVFAAGSALACPDSSSMKNAKADQSPTITSAMSAPAKQTKAGSNSKAVKPAEVKKPTS